MLNMKIWEHPLSSASHSFSYLSREDHDAKCPEDIHVNNANKARCEGYSFQLHPLTMSAFTKILSLLSWIWEWWVWEQLGPRYISLRVMMKQGLREKDKIFTDYGQRDCWRLIVTRTFKTPSPLIGHKKKKNMALTKNHGHDQKVWRTKFVPLGTILLLNCHDCEELDECISLSQRGQKVFYVEEILKFH